MIILNFKVLCFTKVNYLLFLWISEYGQKIFHAALTDSYLWLNFVLLRGKSWNFNPCTANVENMASS